MKKVLFISLIVVVMLLGISLPVYAIDDPDNVDLINAVYVYDMEDGGVGVLIDYNIEYATPPDETVTEAFLAVFVDTDGTTQLKAVAPYTFYNSGYDRGLAWIRFTSTEVATYSIDSTDKDLYEIWMVGNPALGWAGDPPKCIANIDDWNTTGYPEVPIALKVLYYADIFELAWSYDLVETTALGNKLTTLGSNYFENAIPNLRDIAPACFANSEIEPIYEDLDYTTEFYGVLGDLTGTATGAPITLAEGANNITITTTGYFWVYFSQGTSGNATSGNLTVTGSPVSLVSGNNTIGVTGTAPGWILINAELVNTETGIWAYTVGTAFDLTTVATMFGMSRGLFSGIIWFIITIIICVATNRATSRSDALGGSGSKITMIVFDLCIVGGAVLGLMPILPAALLFVCFLVFTGYIIFFRGATI